MTRWTKAEEARVRRAIPDSPYLLDILCLLEWAYNKRCARRS